MSLSTYRQEQRADDAAKAEQHRLDASAAEERRAERRRTEDERAARLREQARADREADRAARQARRQERANRRREAFTPERIYRTGTLGLVVASGLASLPAQIVHFVGIHPMLAPVPLGLEGAAWVMAAGVAYADARDAPAWVRWLLRVLVAACAAFAASINYGYGLSLTEHGLSAADAEAAGAGLAAVTILGPVVFEIRQWVSTLASLDEQARAERKHAARRRRDHRKVLRIARRLISAAPFGTLPAEDAWGRAWGIVHGPTVPGMTPALEQRAVSSDLRLQEARTPSPEVVARRARARIGRRLYALPATAPNAAQKPAKPQLTIQVPPTAKKSLRAPRKRPTPPRRRKGDSPRFHPAARAVAAETARRTPVVTEQI
ncbi:hypothetical protein [Streptomyces decoyicus]|uniref:hypothetical protein n=1 Tax=Streptomyces decoyicus TaxID=249567 RepID=UPI0038689AE9|nr:hypothetical protein OG532_26065 [Streptomyces decoyicus]